MTPRCRYWAASQEAGLERRRLELLEARYDPLTVRRLTALRLRSGWSCLEVAAGAGSIACWLAGRVGPTGSVVATDLDPRFLDGALPVNVEVRQHDILTDPLEDGAFDLVHCRALLCHLDEPIVALSRMAAALRPGGWLFVEDADFVTFEAASPHHPLTPAWNRVAGAMKRFQDDSWFFDPHLGRRLPGLVAALGLKELGHEGLVRIHHGASPAAEYVRHCLEPLRDSLVATVSNADLDAMRAALDDPAFSFIDATSWAAWGRRRPF
jgi:SAM-dependent methyltransferase